MASPYETTKITVDENVKFGVFANAFRVVEEGGSDCFLDFMNYSNTAQEATVVARIRIRRDFLHDIRENMEEALREFGEMFLKKIPEVH